MTNFPSGFCKNVDNVAFYDVITAAELEQLSIQAGVDNCCDLQSIIENIKQAGSILEMGMGHGRVLKYLSSINYAGKVTGIEYCKNLITESYIPQNLDFAKIHADISKFNFTQQFDLILWRWSGICDFSQQEQPLIIKKLASLLSENGSLIIDTVSEALHPIGSVMKNKREHFLLLSNLEIKVYCPNEEEITQYCLEANLQSPQIINYITYKNRQRVTYVCKN
ncbi:MAG: class I SAM-dependent methyltransferase [Gammaproteobacteria bacterium]